MQPRFFVKPLVLAVAATCMCASLPLSAQEAPIKDGSPQTVAASLQLNIAAGPLTPALNQLAQLAGEALSFAPALVMDKSTQGVKGGYTLEQALQLLLLDTGLMAKKHGSNGGYVIVNESDVITFDAIQVIGSRPERYRAVDSSSATGFASDIRDIPRSIQTIPEQVFLDQQAFDLDDVLKNVSGVQAIGNFGNTTDSFLIRGFNVRTVFQDGFRLSIHNTRVQTTNLERVEVLKGAAALLYGQVQPGGLINVITKKPQEEALHIVSSSFDEYGQRYVSGDFTGPLDDSLLYRFVFSHEDSETFRESASKSEIKRTNISPSLTWTIDENNTLTGGFEYIDRQLPVDRGTVLVVDQNGDRSIADTPRSRRFADDNAVSDTRQFNARVNFEHAFSDELSLEAGLHYQYGDGDTFDDNPALGFRSSALLPGIPTIASVAATPSAIVSNGVPIDGQLLRAGFRAKSKDSNYLASLRLKGEKGIHQFVVGGDYNLRNFELENSLRVTSGAGAGIAIPGLQVFDLAAIDIFNPSYGFVSDTTTPNILSKRRDTQIGLYAQDLISFADHWKALVGVRVDRFKRETRQTQFLSSDLLPPALAALGRLPSNIESRGDGDAEIEVSPNLGFVYQPHDNVSLYVSYSESFTPSFILNNRTGIFETASPREGKQVEFGVKGDLFDDFINFNAAVFELEFTNAPNGFNTDGTAIVNGKEETVGFEFDATIEFSEGLNLILNYAYLDAEISGSDQFEGNTPLGVPKYSAGLWATYELLSGPLQGLGFGGGINYSGDRYIDAGNTFELDSYITTDAALWYFIKTGADTQLRLQAGVKNVTDERYYIAAQGTAFDIGIGQPRTLYGSVSFEF